MAITVRRSTMVRPVAETPWRRLWLSNLDLVAPRTHTPSVRFYRRRPDGPQEEGGGFFDGERMRQALAEALVPFYPLAGRLARRGGEGDGRLELDCNGEGVLFVEADAAGTAVEDYGDFAPTMELRRLVPAVEYTDDDVSAFPLLVLQVTHFKCGGVCLGVGTQHTVSDGISTAHFINSWSALCRGTTTQISPTPFLDRTLLRARDPPTPHFHHVEYHPAPPPLLPISSRSTPPPATATATATAVDIFKLTRADLRRLRSQLPAAAAGDGGESGARRRLSTFAMVVAHVWRCACLARNLPPEQPTMMLTAVSGRQRLRPPLPDGYFGNVIFTSAPVADAGTVTGSGGLAAAAAIVQAAVDRVDRDYCQSALDYLELRQPDLSPLHRGDDTFRGVNLGLTSWVQMPIHEADFGWGRPVFMGPGGIGREGLAFVLPSPDGDGSLSVAISLRGEHMERFRELIFEGRTQWFSKMYYCTIPPLILGISVVDALY